MQFSEKKKWQGNGVLPTGNLVYLNIEGHALFPHTIGILINFDP
jgi:hypothetical protein